MTRSISFARSSVVQITGRVVSTALGVVAVALVARYLGQEGYGHYSTVIAFLQLVAILADLGLYLTFLQELGERPVEEHPWRFGSGMTLRLLTGLVAFGLAPIVALFFPYPVEVKLGIALMSVAFWMNQVATMLNIVFQQQMKMTWAVLADVIGRVAFIGATIWAIKSNAGLIGILLANGSNSLVWVVILWIAAYKLLPFRLNINWQHWKTTLIKAWPIGLGIGLNLIYFKADTIILSLYRSASEVGLYGAPYRVLEIIVTVPHLLMGLALPIMASLWAAKNIEHLQRVVQKLFDLFWVIVWPIIGGVMIAATPIMRLVAGQDFVASGPILQILILAAGTIYFGTLFGYLIVVTQQQKRMLWVYGSVAAIGCIAYFSLIPRFTYWGAAWSTVGVELLVALSGVYLVRKKLPLSLNWLACFKAALAAILMSGILYLSHIHNAIALTLIGAALYGIFVIALRVVPRQLIKQVLTNKGL